MNNEYSLKTSRIPFRSINAALSVALRDTVCFSIGLGLLGSKRRLEGGVAFGPMPSLLGCRDSETKNAKSTPSRPPSYVLGRMSFLRCLLFSMAPLFSP